jgi:lipopolysaccharide transport system permease protein
MSLLSPKHHLLAFRDLVGLLTRHRQLTWALTEREIRDRYAGQIFGAVWTVGNPVLLMLIYVWIFRYVFPSTLYGTQELPFDQTTYIMSGMIPWLTVSEIMSKGPTVITSHSNLVKQVIFPIEILPVKVALACFASQLFATLLLMLYVILGYHTLPVTYGLLPLLFFVQFLGMVGIGYVLSSVGTYFRDLKDFVQLFLAAGLFLVPVLYHPKMMPKSVLVVLSLNPFTHMVLCFQDACYFGRFEHPWSWLIFYTFSLGSFYCGYRIFRKLKTAFGNVL